MATENGYFLFACYYFFLEKKIQRLHTIKQIYCHLEYVISLYIGSALSINQSLY